MGWPTQTAETPQPELSVQERDSLILSWRASVTDLAAIKEKEMSQRKTLANVLFPNPAVGTQRFELGAGYSVKLVHKVTTSLVAIDAPDRKKPDGSPLPFIEQMYAVADEIEACGNEGVFLAGRLLKWSCDLSFSEYKALDPANPTHMAIKEIIDRHLVIKPGSPTLELEEPKQQ